MDIVNGFTVTQWLSLEQIRDLLLAGEISIDSPNGSVRLFVNFIDRVVAQELAEK